MEAALFAAVTKLNTLLEGFSNTQLGDIFAVYGVTAMLAYFAGGMVLAGKGTDRDPEAAFQYFTNAATRDPAFHQALFAVADCHLRGHGTVQKDYAAAREHFQRAADAGSAEALTHLGAIYAEGLRVDKDAVAALRFLTQAITAGSRNAAAYLQGLEMRSAGKSG